MKKRSPAGASNLRVKRRADLGAKERIVDTAAALFYRSGTRGVGIDTIVAQSRVAKMSLYRNFSSKEELIKSCLERFSLRFWQEWELAAQSCGSPREELRLFVRRIVEHASRSGYRGCPFINAAIETPRPDHPTRKLVAAFKNQVRERLRRISRDLGAAHPDRLADQLMLLVEGAVISSQTLGSGGPLTQLPAAAEVLVRSNVRRARPLR